MMEDTKNTRRPTSVESDSFARFKDRRHCHWAAHVPSGVARIDRTRRKPYGAPGRAVGVGYPIDNSLLIRKYDPYTHGTAQRGSS